MTFHNVIDERALLTQFQSGDRMAFDQIFRLYNPSLKFFASRFVINYDQIDPQEIVLDTFLKLYDRRETFVSLDSIKAFVYISTKNACLNAIEKEKTRLRHIGKYVEHFDESEDSILNRIVQAEVYQELYHAIDLLPERYRLIMQKTIEGKSSKEISVELEMPVNTVTTQKSRAVSLLKNKLSGAGIALLLFYF